MKIQFIFILFYIYLIILSCEKKVSIKQEKITINSCSDNTSGCPPCDILAIQGEGITSGQKKWPDIFQGSVLKINSFTSVLYEESIPSVWGAEDWWLDDGNDPWSDYPYWGDDYVFPNHQFDDCVNDCLRWMCGYSYVVKIPENYSEDISYPLMIFLHGGVDQSMEKGISEFYWYHDDLLNQFYMSKNDPYVIAAPIKLEVDWDAKKIRDIIEDIKSNLSIENDRIYLTGLSMGGRGTFIVAAEFPDYFASIMPLSPHHEPYSYVPLAKNVMEIPIWMSHGDIDEISSYSQASQMADSLENLGATIFFRTEENIGHWGWDEIYSDSDVMNWFLSWVKTSND